MSWLSSISRSVSPLNLFSGGGGGGGGGSSTSTNVSSDAQIGASEQGQATQGGIAANNGAVVVGDGGSLLTGAVKVSGNNAGDITLGYDAGQFQSALNSVGSNLTNALSAQSSTQSSTLEKVLGQLAPLAESKQTEGVSGLSKTALWGIGIVVSGALAFFLFRKK